MDEDIRFGIGLTGLIVSISFVIGDIGGLIASLAFCSIPWAYEIKERFHSSPMRLETCQLCGNKFRIRNKTMEWEYRTIGLCPICLDSIFQYSKTVPEKPAN
ncbi:hypothetical protein [Methanobacterium sp. BAmetb5]|uniref:hypothetical protein n=1 Tax=Methanobacterium sp. BAmetb5 TaxID=2025351 RepID=UPI000E942001|nr:hypothetical protein [Methanobacterium sp. BAmetb5]AXV40401.1 MAG: hypothetical protein CIT02_08745 [Methanobacterium sp. BAmetb5]